MISSALRAGLASAFLTSPQVVHPARTKVWATALPINPFAPVTKTVLVLVSDIDSATLKPGRAG